MLLGKPPVVEAWIGFRFERRPDSPEPFPDSARQYLLKHSEEYPEAEYQTEQHVKFQHSSPKEPPKTISVKNEVQLIRSFNLSKSRCVQFSKERMVYSAVKTAEPYPGYEALREEAFAGLLEYTQQIDPLHVKAAAIFYKDVVEIPAAAMRIESLSAYFKRVPDFPSECFGDTSWFRYQNVFKCPVDEGPLMQSLQPLPSDVQSNLIRFELTWLKICENANTLDTGTIRQRLDAAHDYVRRCFRASVTDATWALFEPVDD